MANASHKGMGEKGDASGVGEPSGDPKETNMLGEADIASDMMGDNALHGDDQLSVHNQRRAAPDAKLEPDADIEESATMQDKDARAEAELNKGGGVHPGMKQGGIS